MGAVAEALTNVDKHANARRVTIYVEPSAHGQVFCSVKDDGVGFDTTANEGGLGIAGSIHGRLSDAGGRAEISSRPSLGTEVRLWV